MNLTAKILIMCKECVSFQLTNLLKAARKQIQDSRTLTIELKLERMKMCNELELDRVEKRHKPMFICFPGPSFRASKSFAVILRLISLVVSNLDSNKISTIRDLYYQDVSLFKTQDVVYRGMEQLCRYFSISRSLMNVYPSPNGLITGDLTLALENGELLDVKRSNGSSLIPVSKIISATAVRVPEYILVVEKEAVFSYLQAELPEGILLTGKGFPDRATKSLLNALSVSYPQVPIYGLVDSDPHGLLILRNYENEFETGSGNFFKTEVQYLGISLLDYTEGLVPSTCNDIKVSISTLRKDWVELPKYRQFKEELQRGLFMGLKGEMNLIDREKSSCLSKYVREKIEARRLFPNLDNGLIEKGSCHPKLVTYITSSAENTRIASKAKRNELPRPSKRRKR